MTQHTADPILVLGASGKTGRRVVSRLRAAGLPTRAASRSSQVHFDWSDPATWDAALSGVSAVYLALPEGPVPVRDFLHHAAAAGADRLVALSGRGVDRWGEPGEGLLAVEQAVRDSGMRWSIMRPNNFNQNFDEYALRGPVMAGRVALPTGGVPEPFIDAEDVADVATALLTEDGHEGRTYEMSGPAALTWSEAVEQIARASGRRIDFVDLDPHDYVQDQVEAGVPKEEAQIWAAMFDVLRRGHLADPADGVQRVLGREPRDFASYAARAAAAGAWS